ncbi:MAG: hypothetical protein NBV67_09875 [Tagaea sp.]|nr:hypothetical protein [Tagaea sp.]
MNPFRRVWPREIALYLTALALLAQALMGATHAAHAFLAAETAICAAEHEHAPAQAPQQACPLCQLPTFAGPVPPALELAAPIAWVAASYPAAGAFAVPSSLVVLPPARGPPAPV